MRRVVIRCAGARDVQSASVTQTCRKGKARPVYRPRPGFRSLELAIFTPGGGMLSAGTKKSGASGMDGRRDSARNR